MDWESAPISAIHNGGYTTQGPPTIHHVSDDRYPEGDIAHSHVNWDSFASGKQRMFPRRDGQDETGLENLLAGWGLAEPAHRASARGNGGWSGLRWFKGRIA